MITLRDATLEDCVQIWAWRFAEDVRAVSLDPRMVELDEHIAWCTARLRQVGSPMWVIEEAGAGVGVVRMDRLDDGAGMISIALARLARGRGVGRAALRAACQKWSGRVIAIIREDNVPSQTCFEACGFRRLDRQPGLITYAWSPDGES